jgi:hypothetical protein
MLANILVSIVVFGTLGAIVYRQIKSRKKGTGGCHSGCATCPYACGKRSD